MSRAATPGAVTDAGPSRRTVGPYEKAFVRQVQDSGVRWSWSGLARMTGFPEIDLRRHCDPGYAAAAKPAPEAPPPMAPPTALVTISPASASQIFRRAGSNGRRILLSLERGPSNAVALSERMGADTNEICAALRTLSRRDLVESGADPSAHRRVNLWSLTALGQAVVATRREGAA